MTYPDGYIKVKDRSKDIIISGGENISSIEVEDVLYHRHPDVLAAAVVAKPDPRWGETPCALIELKAGAQITRDDIMAHCKKHLAGFKVPRAVEFGELPKTSTGKIQKYELRQKGDSTSESNSGSPSMPEKLIGPASVERPPIIIGRRSWICSNTVANIQASAKPYPH